MRPSTTVRSPRSSTRHRTSPWCPPRSPSPTRSPSQGSSSSSATTWTGSGGTPVQPDRRAPGEGAGGSRRHLPRGQGGQEVCGRAGCPLQGSGGGEQLRSASGMDGVPIESVPRPWPGCLALDGSSEDPSRVRFGKPRIHSNVAWPHRHHGY